MTSARFSPFREEIRRAWRELRGGELSPARGALSVGLGVFIGSLPIFGCHTPLVLVLCLWLRLDAAVAWVAANISNPFFAPFLVTAEWQLGTYLATGAFPERDAMLTLGWASLPHILLGGAVIGAALAVVGGLLTFGGIRVKRALSPAGGAPPEPYRLPASAPEWIVGVEALAGRYARNYDQSVADRTNFHYVRVKTVSDPIAQMIANVGGETEAALGEVLDIGTGRGQLPILLLELGRATRAHGVDWDEAKIAEATRAAAGHVPASGEPQAALDATFARGDARTAPLRPADTVLLIDVLHYFTIEEQDAILDRAIACVRPGGRIIVREADTERGWRSRMTLLEERIFTALGYNRGERVKFRPAREIEEHMVRAGLTCTVEPAWGKTPFSNVLIIGTSAPAASPAVSPSPTG